VIEANIKKEDGPLRSVWEAAVTRGRGPEKQEKKKLNFWEIDDGNERKDDQPAEDREVGDGGDARKSLPSPITPTMELAPLPMSPRTPRSLSGTGRARSVSY
jgi:hypothetical protein